MKRNLFTLVICTALVLGLFSCGGGDVTKSKEYLALKAELDKRKTEDSTEAANIAAYKKLNDDFMSGKKDEFLAYQASKRGGILKVRVAGERVFLGGKAVTVLRGELT